jgi:hypothetical protein
MTKLLRLDYSRVTEIRVHNRDEFSDLMSQMMQPVPLDEPWPPDLTVEVISLFRPTDYIHAYPLDLVSGDLKAVLEAHGVNAAFYPIQMIHRRRPYTERHYYACHILDHLDSYDYERGEYTFHEKPGFTDHVDTISVLAVDEQKAAGHALFRLGKGGELYIVVSDDLGVAIETKRLTGLYFLDLPSDQIHVMGSAHVSPDEDSQRDKVVKVITELHGPPTDFEIVDDDGDAPFTVGATDNGSDVKAVFTNGSSDCDLYLPDGRWINTDVKLLLPASWPVNHESLNDPLWGWPMRWIQKILREAHDAFDYDHSPQWPDDLAAIFMNGDPPLPLAPNTKLCGWVCIHEEEASFEAPPTYWFDIRLLIPIYREEQQLIESEGIHAFLDRLEQRGIPQYIDPDRPNVALPTD